MKASAVRTELFKIRYKLIEALNTYVQVTVDVSTNDVIPSPIINIDNFTAIVSVSRDWITYNDREGNTRYTNSMEAAPIGDLVTLLEMFENKAYEQH